MADEHTLNTVRRVEGRRIAGRILLVLALVASMAGLTHFIPGDSEDLGWPLIWVSGSIAAVCAAVGGFLMLTSRMPAEARTPRMEMIRAERLQSRRRRAFLIMPLSLFLMLTGVIRATGHVMDGATMRHFEIFEVGCFLFFLGAFAFLLAGRGMDRWARPVLDDEVSRAFRGRALQFGYFILLPGVAALFVVGLFSRELAIELAPVLAALGIGGPAVRLSLLERSAATDDIEA